MTMQVKDEYRACLDCLLLVANGDGTDEHAEAMTKRIGPLAHLVCGDSDQDDEFSWAPCECCGSRLGGSRHQLIMLEPAEVR